MATWTKVKRFNLFKEDKAPGARTPDYKNSKVIFEVALDPGHYSFGAWQYEDTGNISVEIQRVDEDDDGAAYRPANPQPQRGGFDD